MYNDRSSDYLAIALVIAIVIGLLAIWLVPQTVTNDTTITVTDKVVKVDGNNSRYLVFAGSDVYEITDAVYVIGDAAQMRFDSSDLYGSIDVGDTYDIHTVGLRVPFLSWYPNIMSASEVE